jgi:hypothetical protein
MLAPIIHSGENHCAGSHFYAEHLDSTSALREGWITTESTAAAGGTGRRSYTLIHTGAQAGQVEGGEGEGGGPWESTPQGGGVGGVGGDLWDRNIYIVECSLYEAFPPLAGRVHVWVKAILAKCWHLTQQH